MSNAAEAREELAKVSSLVLTARRLLAGGTLVDLTAIEERVRLVCTAVEGMPREDGQTLLEDMLTLIEKLEQLATDLQDHLKDFEAVRKDGG